MSADSVGPKISKRGGARANSGGRRSGAGRKKGTPNKITKSVKDAILAAFDTVGGPKYLARQAEENPAAFMTLLGKVLPTQISGDGGGPVQIEQIERVIVDAAD
jgi:hypothetical protein